MKPSIYPFIPPSIDRINAAPKKYKAVSFFAGCGGSSTGYKMAGFDILYANEFVPIAREDYESNAAPHTIVDGRDIREVDVPALRKQLKLKVGELDFMDGSPPCFLEGTLINTRRGLLPIEQVVEGDYVLTHNGRYRRVYATMKRNYKGNIFEVKAVGGIPLKTTDEHPFYTRRNDGGIWDISCKLGKPSWVEAKDLMEGDFVAHPVDISVEPYEWHGVQYRPVYHRITKELISSETLNTLPVDNPHFWWVVGRWLGDGWLRYTKNNLVPGVTAKKKRASVIICCDGTDETELDEITYHLGCLGYTPKVNTERTVLKLLFGNVEWCEFLSQFGKGASGKHVPNFVHHLSNTHIKALLKGYISADGYVNSGTIKYSTVSKKLALGIAQLIRSVYSVGVSMTVITRTDNNIIEGRTVKTKPNYVCTFMPNPDAVKYMYVNDDNHVWSPVRKISKVKSSCTVYNISVEQDESYVADGYVVHNCAAFSMAGRRDEQWGKPVPYSEKIVQRVDDLFDHYIRMIDGFKPKVFVAENVTGLALGEARGFLIEILESLTKLGYVVDARIIDASQLGLAQKRRRLIIMGVRNDVAKKLKITASNLPYPKPLKKPVVSVGEVLPNIARIRISKGDHAVFVVPDRPSPTITASDAINSLKSCMSCGAWVDDVDGTRRKYTIDEAKVLFGFPHDYRLSGRFVQQFERLGRSHSPCSTYYIGKAIIDGILSKRGI